MKYRNLIFRPPWFDKLTTSGFCVIISACLYTHSCAATSQATNAYMEGDFATASKQYQDLLLADPQDYKTMYNLGAALYQQQDYAASANYFEQAALHIGDPVMAEQAWFNAGNAFVQIKEHKKALDAYKKAVDLVPTDQRARHNYEILKKMDDNKPEQENKKDNNKQDKDKQDQKKPDEQQKKDEAKQEKQQGSNDQDKQQGKQQQQGDNGQQPDGQQPPHADKQRDKHQAQSQQSKGGSHAKKQQVQQPDKRLAAKEQELMAMLDEYEKRVAKELTKQQMQQSGAGHEEHNW